MNVYTIEGTSHYGGCFYVIAGQTEKRVRELAANHNAIKNNNYKFSIPPGQEYLYAYDRYPVKLLPVKYEGEEGILGEYEWSE